MPGAGAECLGRGILGAQTGLCILRVPVSRLGPNKENHRFFRFFPTTAQFQHLL